MKGKLITNGVLSLLSMIGLILMVSFSIKSTKAINTGEYSEADIRRLSVMFSLCCFEFWSLKIASLVMGIVTLSTMGKNKSGLVIASGVLGILGGVFGSNAVVSFIAASKVS